MLQLLDLSVNAREFSDYRQFRFLLALKRVVLRIVSSACWGFVRLDIEKHNPARKF
jgi:hypothetical protein